MKKLSGRKVCDSTRTTREYVDWIDRSASPLTRSPSLRFGFDLSPQERLLDSHIFQPQRGAALDVLEVVETFAHYAWTWFSVVSGPAAEASNDPAGKG